MRRSRRCPSASARSRSCSTCTTSRCARSARRSASPRAASVRFTVRFAAGCARSWRSTTCCSAKSPVATGAAPRAEADRPSAGSAASSWQAHDERFDQRAVHRLREIGTQVRGRQRLRHLRRPHVGSGRGGSDIDLDGVLARFHGDGDRPSERAGKAPSRRSIGGAAGELVGRARRSTTAVSRQRLGSSTNRISTGAERGSVDRRSSSVSVPASPSARGPSVLRVAESRQAPRRAARGDRLGEHRRRSWRPSTTLSGVTSRTCRRISCPACSSLGSSASSSAPARLSVPRPCLVDARDARRERPAHRQSEIRPGNQGPES